MPNIKFSIRSVLLCVALAAVGLTFFGWSTGFQGFANGKPVWVVRTGRMIRISHNDHWQKLACFTGAPAERLQFARYLLSDHTLFATKRSPIVLISISSSGQISVSTPGLSTGEPDQWSKLYDDIRSSSCMLSDSAEARLHGLTAR